IPSHKSKNYFHPIGNRPKGSLGHLIGYNDELQSFRILAEDGKIIETKHVDFLDFEQPKKTASLDDDLESIFEDNQAENAESVYKETEENLDEVEDEPDGIGEEEAASIEAEENFEENLDEDDDEVAVSLIPTGR
ncbi:hypothetical protein VP01_11622g1, partial [Puccinia sorghi]